MKVILTKINRTEVLLSELNPLKSKPADSYALNIFIDEKQEKHLDIKLPAGTRLFGISFKHYLHGILSRRGSDDKQVFRKAPPIHEVEYSIVPTDDTYLLRLTFKPYTKGRRLGKILAHVRVLPDYMCFNLSEFVSLDVGLGTHAFKNIKDNEYIFVYCIGQHVIKILNIRVNAELVSGYCAGQIDRELFWKQVEVIE